MEWSNSWTALSGGRRMAAWTSLSIGSPPTPTTTWTSNPTIHPMSRGVWSDACTHLDMRRMPRIHCWRREQSPPSLVILSYAAGISKDIRQVCRKYGMKVVFRSGLSLHSVLTWVKDSLPMEKWSKTVYRIPCSCGKVYIGETRSRLKTRLREHQEACRKGTQEKSAVAEHAWKDQHAIKWKETTVVDMARHLSELFHPYQHDPCQGTPQQRHRTWCVPVMWYLRPEEDWCLTIETSASFPTFLGW